MHSQLMPLVHSQTAPSSQNIVEMKSVELSWQNEPAVQWSWQAPRQVREQLVASVHTYEQPWLQCAAHGPISQVMLHAPMPIWSLQNISQDVIPSEMQVHGSLMAQTQVVIIVIAGSHQTPIAPKPPCGSLPPIAPKPPIGKPPPPGS